MSESQVSRRPCSKCPGHAQSPRRCCRHGATRRGHTTGPHDWASASWRGFCTTEEHARPLPILTPSHQPFYRVLWECFSSKHHPHLQHFTELSPHPALNGHRALLQGPRSPTAPQSKSTPSPTCSVLQSHKVRQGRKSHNLMNMVMINT